MAFQGTYFFNEASKEKRASAPTPPYNEQTPYGGDHKLKCFFHGCTKELPKYTGMMNHIKSKHGFSQAAFKGTPFYDFYMRQAGS